MPNKTRGSLTSWYSASLHLSAPSALFFSCPRTQLLLLGYFGRYSSNGMLRQLVRYFRFKHPEKPTTIVRPLTAFWITSIAQQSGTRSTLAAGIEY